MTESSDATAAKSVGTQRLSATTRADSLAFLDRLRAQAGQRRTEGLAHRDIEQFLARSPALQLAIERARTALTALDEPTRSSFGMDEEALCQWLQERLLNFYSDDGISPYVPLGAAGPWIVTTHGAVLHDSAGYGMLGLGHGPDEVIAALAEPLPMANVMTPSLSQKRFTDRLVAEIGRTRGRCPFGRFVCMNSGSEAVTVAARIADIHAKTETDPGARHAGKAVRVLSLEQGFHGRTYRPAQMSSATRPIYEEHLASFRTATFTTFVPANDIGALERAFALADDQSQFFEAMFVEPVLGEGDSGLALSREFYDAARRLTRRHGALLVVDSIQAALRAHGCLSVVDYPGFEDCEPPDMETYSKALNAGQYPLSVLAMTDEVADIYVRGVYGNTMTTNARALEVGCAVLDSLTEELRANVRERGKQLRDGLTVLGQQFRGAITSVRGTGLIVCADLDPARYRVEGRGGFESYCRTHGVAMIHGGHNGLRFTPHLGVSAEEVELILRTVRAGLEQVDQRG